MTLLPNVRFRWIEDVGKGLLHTESGRSGSSNDRRIVTHCFPLKF